MGSKLSTAAKNVAQKSPPALTNASVRLSPNPPAVPARPPSVPPSGFPMAPPEDSAAVPSKILAVDEIKPELLEQAKAWGPLTKKEQTKMPMSPLHISDVEAQSAAATRYYRELAAIAAEAELGGSVHAGLRVQTKSKGPATASDLAELSAKLTKLPKRSLPSDRNAVREADSAKEWQKAQSSAPGRVSESQLVTLMELRRDKPQGDLKALAASFNLERNTLDLVFAHVGAPHYAYDKETEIDFGTWEARVSHWDLANASDEAPSSKEATK